MTITDIFTLSATAGIWDMISSVAGAAVGGSGAGAVFGLFGSAIGQVSKYFQRKQEQKFQREKWGHAVALQELNMKAKKQETEQELAIVSQQGAWSGLASSIQADAAVAPASSWATDIKVLFRPALTVGLWVLAWLVFNEILTGSLRQWMTDAEIKDIIKYMVYTVFFSASTAGVWWFGDRALTPPEFKNR